MPAKAPVQGEDPAALHVTHLVVPQWWQGLCMQGHVTLQALGLGRERPSNQRLDNGRRSNSGNMGS